MPAARRPRGRPSHDRWFLDRISTHILAFEGESKVTFFDGNFSEYEEWRMQTLGDAAIRPQPDHVPDADEVNVVTMLGR